MAAPVIQEGQKIKMTAPVIQTGSPGGFAVQFVMPSKWTLSTLPKPNDKNVSIRKVPAARFAVIRYSGFWSRSRYESQLARLQSGMAREHIKASGQPVWARYDPPFMPWFLRRNEISDSHFAQSIADARSSLRLPNRRPALPGSTKPVPQSDGALSRRCAVASGKSARASQREESQWPFSRLWTPCCRMTRV